jgi:hypothetical protein
MIALLEKRDYDFLLFFFLTGDYWMMLFSRGAALSSFFDSIRFLFIFIVVVSLVGLQRSSNFLSRAVCRGFLGMFSDTQPRAFGLFAAGG